MHTDSDGNTIHCGQDDAAPRRKQVAVTPKSAAFGSPVPVDPWTGCLPAQLMDNDGLKKTQARPRHQERRAKPSFFDTGSAPSSDREKQKEYMAAGPGASNVLDQERRPLLSSSPLRAVADESSDPFHPSQKSAKKQIDAIDSTYPNKNSFSDPKGTSQAPNPRAASSQTSKTHGGTVTIGQTKNKGMFQFSSVAASLYTQPLNSPCITKLTDAMRGTSALAPNQGTPTKMALQERSKRNRPSNKGPKLAALDLDDPELFDRDDPFDTANVPPSQGGSPGAVKSRTKEPPKQPVSKSKQPANRKSKQTTKGKNRAKASLSTKQAKVKKLGSNVHQKDDDIANSNPHPEKRDETLQQSARRTRQRRGRVPHVEEQEPITITSGSSVYDSADLKPSTDSKDADYAENYKSQRVATSSRTTRASKRVTVGLKQPLGGTEKPVRAETELNPQTQFVDASEEYFPKKAPPAERVPRIGDDSETRLSLLTTQKGKSNTTHSTKSVERDTNHQSETLLGTVRSAGQDTRKPTIVPFDAMGPKTSGVSRAKSNSNIPQRTSRHSTDTSEEKTTTRLRRPTITLENTHPHSQRNGQKIGDSEPTSNLPEAEDCAPRIVADCSGKGLSSSTEVQTRAMQESSSPVRSADEHGTASDCPSQEAAPFSNDQTDARDGGGPVFMGDDDLANELTQASHEAVAHGIDDHHQRPDNSSTDGDHLINAHSNLFHPPKKSIQGDFSTTVKASLKRSVPSDEIVQPLPSVEHHARSNLQREAVSCPQPHKFEQAALVPLERAAKKPRLGSIHVGAYLEPTLPQSGRKALLLPTKRSSGESSGATCRIGPETSNGTLVNLISMDYDDPGSMPTAGAQPSKLCWQDLTETLSEPKPAPKRDIAQRFLADMAARSKALDQDGDEHTAETLEDVPWHQGHNEHQEQPLIRRISERERAFEEAQATPGQALVEAMHRIVGGVLRRLKEKELAVDNIADDYGVGGRNLVQRTAKLHANERRQVQEFCEQKQRDYIQMCGAARQQTASYAKQIQALSLGTLPKYSGSASTLDRLNRVQQMLPRT